jgi:Flp pilus assembly protein TadD
MNETRERMKEYRIKMGVDVRESATDHAQEIDEAVKIAKLAIERGIYSTAVSALEKVTAVSSDSKVGSTVFLELAMAYEAVGRIDEASQVYNR